MTRRRVVKLRRAEADVRVIAIWLAERSRDGAARWLEALETALDRLSENAESCSEADEADVVPEHVLQQFLFRTRRGRTFRGVFTIVGDEVRVLRIRGPGQAPLTADELNL
jgi:plasmid stabilization system protein ParE